MVCGPRSSTPQLGQKDEIIRDAMKAGVLENALLTSGKSVSQGAQDQFNSEEVSVHRGNHNKHKSDRYNFWGQPYYNTAP